MEQVEGTKTDVEKRVERILKLIKRRNRVKKEPELVGLVEDFHKQYQSLYAQYDQLRRESSKKADDGKVNESCSYYASSSDSEYYSSEDIEMNSNLEFNNNRSSHRRMADNTKEELERANVEVANLKNQLASKTEEKEALASDHLAALSKIQEIETINRDLRKEVDEKEKRLSALGKVHQGRVTELEEQLTGLKTELESLHHQKRDLEDQLDGKTAEAKQQGKTNKALYSEFELIPKEEGDAVTKLMEQIMDNENNLMSKIEDSMAQVSNLKKEVDYLRAQKCEAEGSIACKSSESFDQENVMREELDSLRSQKTESEILLETKSKEISQYLIQVKSLKEELVRKSAVQQKTIEEKEGLQVQVMNLESEVHTLRKQKNISEDEVRSNIREINQLREEKGNLLARILELETLFRERGLELSAVQEDSKSINIKVNAQIRTLNAEVELLQQKLDSLKMEKSQLELQIADQQRITKEREEAINKSMEESNSKVVRRWSSGSTLNSQVLERKIEELAEEFRKKVEDNIRLLYQRIKVAEKIHFENKETHKIIKERLEQENGALEEKLANYETEFRKLRDTTEPGKTALSDLTSAVIELEDEGNSLTRISNVTGDLVSADDCKQLKSNVDLVVAELNKEKEESLEAKLREQGEEKLNLMKAVSGLENRVGELEKIMKDKDETLLGLQEEKREAIRQLCLLIDYHRCRCDYLKEFISKLIVRSQKKMTKRRFRESIKSFFGHHVDPEKDEQLKGSKIEIDDKVTKILKLIKDEEVEENDGISIANSKKEPLVQLIEDFHKHYQNLYAQYDHLTGELRKKVHGKREKDASSSSSSDSESDYSSKDGGGKNGQLESEFQKIAEGIKQELEMAKMEIADLKRKLTATNEEKDALHSENLASLSKLQEAEEIVRNLKLESERSESEKSKLVAENEELRLKLDTAGKMEAEVNQRLEDLNREKDNLILEKETAVKRIEDGEKFTEDLRREVDQLKEENITLKQEVESVRGEVSNVQQQLESAEQQVSELSHSLNATVADNKSLNSELSKVSNEIQQAQGTIQQLMADMSQSKDEIGEKERELLTLKELHEVHGNQSSAQIKELEAQVTSLELELASLRATNRDLEVQIENKAAEVIQVGEQNRGLQSQISELEMMSKKREDELLILTKKFEDNEKESLSRVENLTVQINNLLVDMDSVRTQKSQLEEHIVFKSDEASNQVKSLMDQINRLQQELEFLHSQKAELEMQLERKTHAISDYAIAIEKAKEEIVRKTEDQQRVLQEKEGLVAQRKDLEFEVNSLKNHKGELEQELETKIEENGQLREEKVALRGQIFELEKKLAETGLEFTALQEKHASAENELREEKVGLQGQIFELEKKLAERGLEFTDLQEKHATAENEASSQLIALEDQVNNLQQELDSLRTQRNELELQLEREKQESLERISEMENQKLENGQLREEKVGLQGQIFELEKTLAERGLEFTALQEKHVNVENEASSRLTALEVQVKNLKQELDSLQTQRNELELQLERRNKNHHRRLSEMENQKLENGQLREKKLDLEDRILEFEKTLAERGLEFTALQEKHVSAENEASSQLTALEVQVKHLKQELDSLQTQRNELELQLERKKQESSERLSEMENQKLENGQLREKKLDLEDRILEFEKTLAERGLEFTALQEKHVSAENEASSQLTALEVQVKHLKQELDSLQTQRNELELQLEREKQESSERLSEITENETSSQLTALVVQVNNLQQELDSLQTQRNEQELQLEREKQESSERLTEMENHKSELESQINNQQSMLEEQGEAHKKLAEECKQVERLYQDCRENLEVAERKIEEMSEEFHRNIESKSQMAADLKQMVEDLQRDLEAKGVEKNDFTNQITDHQRMLKEQEDAFNKLSEEYKQLETSFQDCKVIIEVTERKMQEMAGEHNMNVQSKDQRVADLEQIIDDLKSDLEMKVDELNTLVENVRTIEVKLRLSNQKLRVTEQLLTEKEESFRTAEAKFLEEQRILEERITTLAGTIAANQEAHCRMITDIAENVNSTLTGFEAVIQNLEEGYGNYEHCVEETSKELRIAKHWVAETKSEKKRLINEVTSLIEQLKDQKERESMLRERAEKLRTKADKEERERENLIKAVKHLEKKVEFLETVMKEKDQGIVGLGEEKREAIRQLCVWIDYHRSRCDDLREILSKTTRVQRAT
ncbi:golgin subfamily B member 1-like [Herrania umbratica]|uniref:Golgin subfamily B member 1-like n=1 Tax=Herrania umbratica TaxID=108875 RepID=A0A6J1AQ58_9ROSI|nr:golgin subfamily B member 1-like [Herrania umbratica]